MLSCRVDGDGIEKLWRISRAWRGNDGWETGRYMMYGGAGMADTRGVIHHGERTLEVDLAGSAQRAYLIDRPCMTARMGQKAG